MKSKLALLPLFFLCCSGLRRLDSYTSSPQQCMNSCIDSKKVFCPQDDHYAGYCCSSGSNCQGRESVCTDEVSYYVMKIWSCPFDPTICGNSLQLFAPQDGQAETMKRTVNQFGARGLCMYLVSFPSESKVGDKLLLLINSIENAYGYVVIGTDYDKNGMLTTLEVGTAYEIEFPQHAFITYVSEDLNGAFQFSYLFQESKDYSDSQWIVVNNVSYVFNLTRDSAVNETDDSSNETASSSSSVTIIQPDPVEESTLSSTQIIMISCIVGGVALISLITILIVAFRLKKKKTEVQVLIKEHKSKLKEPVQMLFQGATEGETMEGQQLGDMYHQYLMKKFGTTEVTDEMFFRVFKHSNFELSRNNIESKGVGLDQKSDFGQIEDLSQKRMLGQDSLGIKEEEKDTIDNGLLTTSRAHRQTTLGRGNQVAPDMYDNSVVVEAAGERKGGFLPPITGRVRLPPIAQAKIANMEMFEEVID